MGRKKPLAISTNLEIGDAAWSEVLQAMDRTYAELVDYQEQLEARHDELLVLRRFLASIMGSISDYLVVTEKNGLITNASASFCSAMGVQVELLQGSSIQDYFSPEQAQLLSDAISQTIAQREDTTVEAALNTANGVEPVEFRVAPRLDRRRKSIGAVLTGRPLGELRRAYSELEFSHEELKQAQTQLVRNEKLASLGRLLAGVAHELNNPISFVYANTHALEKYVNRFETYFELVQAGASRDELVQLRQELRLDRDLGNLRSALVGARDGAERVRDIVADLRRLSADGSGEISEFDLVETARVGANWVQRGTKKALTITFEGEETLIAQGRTGHIQQVIMNLVQNAIDAAAETVTPELRISARYDDEWAILDVCDNGPGVPPEHAQAIFDPFFTTKVVGAGTGLGLSISHKIAEEHGGSLELIDNDAPGACFRLKLRRGE